MTASGWAHDADYPPTDFAAVARAKGADGLRVVDAHDLEAALQHAVNASGPFVVDVVIDPAAAPVVGHWASSRSRRSTITPGLETMRAAHTSVPLT